MLYRFLVLSLAVHMVFAATLLQVDSEALSDPQPIEVTYISPDQNRASFVTDPNQNIEDSIRELKDKVNRLSRQTRRVLLRHLNYDLALDFRSRLKQLGLQLKQLNAKPTLRLASIAQPMPVLPRK